MKQKNPANPNESKTEVTLTFEADTVSASWYHPKLNPILCALCEKDCNNQPKPAPGTLTVNRCVNINPYCG